MSNNQISKQNNQAAKDLLISVAKDVYYTKIFFVGAYFVDVPETDSWFLVDTGLPMSQGKITKAAEAKFGNQKPSAIVLTHGHFDHAGAALALAEHWNIPIYAHRLEMPYLIGKSDYPPQDPTVGGAIAQMSRMFPHGGCDFGNRVRELPESGEIPSMPEWKFLHTPGHTAGHISLWRESDRTLLAGDALTTINADSWISMLTEKREFCRPPAPFTTDWQAARRSVEMLADLEPKAVGAGHGKPMTGANIAQQLKELARSFTPPSYGHYINAPAICDESGVVALPPPVLDYYKAIAGTVAGIAVGATAARLIRRNKKQKV